MYLKSIELYGFKSFAERTELEFVPGVTAVVGPNGSGKSNVADAIRWVLGEQSAKSLRGAKMEDIIFAGSDTRKAINYSEVALTLDNTDRSLGIDYSEVTITRRVYRSGESEYLLNKQPCRLKDITELLMDTGLGKEAYSIIGQGRIDEILSTKSEDRRGIFEEAAGVVKYKSRKQEASRKLEETEANLVRIQDIIHEVEEQLEPLGEQARKAEQYRELMHELKQREISTYVYQIESLHREWEEASAHLDELKQQEEHSSVELNRQEAELEKTKWHLSQLEQQSDVAGQQLLELTEEVEKMEGQREVLKERKKNFSANKQEIMHQMETLELRRQEKDQELKQEKQALHDLRTEVRRLQDMLTKHEQSFQDQVQNVDERLEDLKGEYIDHLNEQASLKHELRHLDQSIEQYRYKLNQVKDEHQRYISERQVLQNRIRQKENKLNEQAAHLEKLHTDYKHLQHQKLTLTDEIEHHEEAYRRALSEWEQKKSRMQLLREMKEDFTGFHQGVKEVLKAREKELQGIEGAIAELIQVPARLETAMQTALGAGLQHIIVRDEQAGREAIHYLKKRKLGRATFLPLSVLKPRQIPKHDLAVLQNSAGFVGVASSLISFRSQYRPVLENILGSVVITHSLKEANKIAQAVQYRYRLVTLDGDVVNPGGAMTGGALQKKRTNLLGREREIEQLTEQIQQGQISLATQEESLNALKQQLVSSDEQLSDIRQQSEKAKEEEQILKEERSQLTFQKTHMDEKLTLYDQESATYAEEHKEAQQKREQVQQTLQEYDQQCVELEEEIQRLEEQKKENEVTAAEKNEEMTQVKVQLARKKQELEGSERHAERISQTKLELDHEQEELQQHLTRLKGDLGKQGHQEDDLEQSIKQKNEEKEERTLEVEMLRKERKEAGHQLTEFEAQIKHMRHEHKSIAENIHREEVKVNRLDVELENYLTLLREEYELSFELAREKYPLPEEYDTVKQEVDRLKAEIQRLGTINAGAVEEYQRLNERYTFLRKQEDDLLQAKQTLYEMIAEMDAEMSKRFKSTFDQVRTQFLDVFQQLFGGGRADLHLTDPEDLLHTGIDIVAQPPGKKLQHLGLLSGGERALTAIVLLFAILKVKPVPFCVLDEVEAALDEANVSRFAEYLREFAKETQFIVITHRKGTMEGADVLYGITMQESGVSTLVSVKLEEKEEVITA